MKILNKKNLASIIIVNYNNAKYIDQCVKSILNQSYNNIEIIFIDDISKDNSLSVINKYKKKIKIIKKNKKIGIGSFDQMAAFLIGAKKSSGEILFFLDSDDFFKRQKISEIMKIYKINRKIKLLYDLPIEKYDYGNKKIDLRNKYFQRYWPYFVPTSCITMKKEFFFKIYKEININNFPDIWFDFRVGFISFYKFKQYNFFKKNLTIYRKTNQNVSSKFKHMSKTWWQRRQQAHDFVNLLFNKNNIKHRINFDFLITKLMNIILR
jgi:glycosyltransferase involved in cell wall biosynthesis